MTKISTYNSSQIGGNVVTIETETTRIAIDFGANLPGSEGEEVEIEGLTQGDPQFDAVFFTHYHGDHIGRMKDILPGVPLYMGDFAKQVMFNIFKARKNQEMMEFLQDKKRVFSLHKKKTVKIGDIRVTPYMVDHSAYEAFMFLIETPDKNILHTGDFRTHGYHGKDGKVLMDVIKKYIRDNRKRTIHTLIIEGTMLSRMSEKRTSEQELQTMAKKFYENHKYVFLICSSVNFDSLWSFYSAGISMNPMRYMNGNPYVIDQLNTIREYTKNEPGNRYNFKYIAPYFAWKLPEQKKKMIENGFVCVIKADKKYEKWIDEFKEYDPAVIYCEWDGYLDSKTAAYDKEKAAFCEKYKAESLHSGGHAPKEDIEAVIQAVDPMEIVPIHTEAPENFYKLSLPEGCKIIMEEGR